ncbi:MAG: glycosyl hydrolase family 28-related protein [Kiritimatiellia bacterium]
MAWRFLLALAAGLWCGAASAVSVTEFGAKGDGVTDDTAAIQAAIDAVAARGGGKITFPYTPKGYRLSAPGRETYGGRPCRAQLCLPAQPGLNLAFEGEMPCKLLYSYMVRPPGGAFRPTTFGRMGMSNTCLFSDWLPPAVTNATARPWAILAAAEGTSCAGKFGAALVSVANLEFRVRLDKEKMYPRQSGVNLQNVSRAIVRDSQFCLDDCVGDAFLGKELQPNPCHTVGLMMSGDQNDNQVLDNVAVQGFRYGLVLGEHTVASYLYVHNCEEGIVFHDSTHLSMINHVVAQHNRTILATTRTNLFGHRKGICNVIVGGIDYEHGHGTHPAVSQMKYGVYDPESRFRGRVVHHQGWPGDGTSFFPVVGAKNLCVRALE